MAKIEVYVKVVLHAEGSPDNFHFETTYLPMVGKNVLYFRNAHKSDFFRIHYVLDNSKRLGFLFPPVGPTQFRDALWVHESPDCPDGQCDWQQFKVQDVSIDRFTLTVDNKNDPPETSFSYTLRVTDGHEWLELDPGGENKDSGIVTFSSMLAAAITGAVTSMAAAMFANSALAPTDWLLFGLAGALAGLIIGFVFKRL